MRINWRRGFLRAWLVLAVSWIGAIGWLEYNDQIDPFAPEVQLNGRSVSQLSEYELLTLYRKSLAANASPRERILVLGPRQYAIVFAPPLALFALGAVLGWIMAGFRPVPQPAAARADWLGRTERARTSRGDVQRLAGEPARLEYRAVERAQR
jgi:hypothetical protein